MTDTQDPNPTTTAPASAGAPGATVVGVIADDPAVQAAGGAVTDHAYAAIVASFADETAAIDAYETLAEDEGAGLIRIDGVLVIKTDDQLNVHIQKMTDHSTTTGVKWGAVGGVVAGILFPPSIIVSAISLGVVGGVLGKLRQEFHKSDVAASLVGTLGPNQSGILALVAAEDVDLVLKAIPGAVMVRSAGVDDQTAKAIAEAATQAS
ncbi:MAG: hypothetical protein ACHQZR_02750 [Candidatus Limnocylindrales bacterium]